MSGLTVGERQFSARVIEDSMAPSGSRLTTLALVYPRFIHAEFMTHRVFSRNASSSRAIPVETMIKQVRDYPAAPLQFMKNKAGMQASEPLEYNEGALAFLTWERAAQMAAHYAEELMRMGVHKQFANRLLEPFQLIKVVVSATEWQNFFALRLHKDAQPEIQYLAKLIQEASNKSTPSMLDLNHWHLPFVSKDERKKLPLAIQIQASAARCARVSYANHDGTTPSVEKDVELYQRLVGSEPLHASPIEHQAKPGYGANWESGNFKGWIQFRKLLERDKLALNSIS